MNRQQVRFLFDPVCPWSWRASRWVRAAAQVRPLDIQWELLSLAFINRSQPTNPMLERQRRAIPALRLLAKVQTSAGNQGLDRMYWAVGRACHEQGQEIDDEEMLARSLAQCGLPQALLRDSREDGTLEAILESRYEEACREGAFGVPTICVQGSQRPFYGPVIEPVPVGEEAGVLWDLISGLCQKEYFYEIKRLRG
jgi:2-hydroxychromene-2-carboxylate isomerase